MNRHRTIHHPESFVAPTGFALEGLTVCEKGLRENRKETSPPTPSQELHHAERPAAPQR